MTKLNIILMTAVAFLAGITAVQLTSDNEPVSPVVSPPTEQLMSMDEVAALSTDATPVTTVAPVQNTTSTPEADVSTDVQLPCREDPSIEACVVVYMKVYDTKPIRMDTSYAKPLVGKAESVGLIYKVTTPQYVDGNLTATWDGEHLTQSVSSDKEAIFQLTSYYLGKEWGYFRMQGEAELDI